jgi:hypothetical protein
MILSMHEISLTSRPSMQLEVVNTIGDKGHGHGHGLSLGGCCKLFKNSKQNILIIIPYIL